MLVSNKIIIFFIYVLISSYTHAQYAEVNATITYTYELPKLSYKHDYKLIVKNRISKYQHHSEKEEFKTPTDILVEMNKDYYTWFYDASTNKVTEQRIEEDGTKLLAKWDANLKWKITNETKEINGYKVQKAITKSFEQSLSYPDGDAIAWFTTEIPISSGPERYYGLPGLIIRLEFTKDSQIIYLKSINYDKVPEIKIPSDGIPITKEETIRFDIRTKKWLKNKKKQ